MPTPHQTKPSLRKASCFLFLVSYLFLIGATDITLTDVQGSFLEKDYTKTKQLAETFVGQASDPKQKMEALYILGLSNLWLGQYLPARQNFEEILKEKISREMRDKTSLGIIDTYYMEGSYNKSLSLAEDLLSRSSRSEFISSIYLKLARSNLKLGRWKKGREYLEKIIKDYPNSLERYHVEQLLQESQYFAVQVGSFQDRAKAESVVTDLQQKGEYAYVVETASQDGKKFYRVRVGKFKQFDEAQQLEGKLAQLGYPTKIYP